VAPRLNGWLSDPSSPSVEYEFGEIGGRQIIMVHINGRKLVYAEYASPVAIPAAWSARAGNYTPTDWVGVFPGKSLQLAVQDGMLVMTAGEIFVLLAATSDTLAYVRGLGRGKGSAVKAAMVDGHEEIQFLGVRYRKN
jgi:hypothetical protein